VNGKRARELRKKVYDILDPRIVEHDVIVRKFSHAGFKTQLVCKGLRAAYKQAKRDYYRQKSNP
jgi:hypothetical protein